MTEQQVTPEIVVDSDQPSDFYVVGIGASAGGLQPLEDFFANLPLDTGACFVVVQHLSPDFKSLMKELLERSTSMPICKVEHQMAPKPNSIFLIPPGHNLVLRDRHFHLSSQNRDLALPAPQYPINLFFQSLAEEYGDQAMGVILSGTGTDGTRGLQAINEAGGLTFVQEPTSAEFDGMPNSAINTRIIDQILSPDKLAQRITSLMGSLPLINDLRAETKFHKRAEPYLEQIIQTLAEKEKVDFSYYREKTLSRRIHRRCIATGFQSLEDYVQHLQQSEEERVLLRSDLLIKVTHFFRNPEAWSFLEKQILPGLIDIMEPNNPLRLWSAACATGEEAYSLALLLHELADHANKPVHAKIFATDLDQDALDQASQGIYPETIRNELPSHLLKKYFDQKGDDTFQIKREIREIVIFANHNLVTDAGFTKLHLVSCRNVLIYMQAQLQQKVLCSLNFSLRSNGILFLGESENLGDVENAFVTLQPRWKLYQKFRGTGLLNLPQINPMQLRPTRRTAPRPTSSLDPILESTLRSIVMRRSATCLVIDRHNELVHVAGGSTDILVVPEGRLTNKLSDRVVPSLRLPLSTAINRARRAGEEGVFYRGIALRENPPLKTVKLEVWHQEGNTPAGDCVIVLIEADEPVSIPATITVFEPGDEAQNQIAEVEYELQQTRENLQATIEELETTNEEQQATNEELVASNEELQSTNEELHSVNEELYTVNSEYQAKIQELLELNSDMDNLLESTEIGVVFLDKHLTIRKFTPAARTVFKLVDSDLGRAIGDLSHNMELDNFEELALSVLGSDRPLSREIKLQANDLADQYLLIRMHPYHLLGRDTDGIVVSFVDISRLKVTEQSLRQTQVQLTATNEGLEQRVQERTQVLQSFSQSLEMLLQVKASTYNSEIEQLEAYLEVGKSVFGLSQASLFCLEQHDLRLAAVSSSEPLSVNVGQTFSLDLNDAWLPWELNQKAIALTPIDPLDLDQHPLYGNAGIQTYFATQLQMAGNCVGILEFVSKDVRTTDFEQTDFEILELIAISLLDAISQSRTHQILQAQEAMYRRLYNETPVMLHSIDQAGCLLSVSDYWLEKMGYTRETVLGQQATVFMTEASQLYAQRVVLPEFLKAGVCWDIPYQFIRKDGQVLDVLLSSTAEKDATGEIIQSLAVMVDVTESRRLQHELQQAQALAKAKTKADLANRAKNRFLASITHELRTPLNSILGFSELLSRDTTLNPDQQEEITTIRRSGHHLLSLINDVLDLSKIEAEQFTLVNTHFDLYTLLEQDIANIFQPQAISKQLTFKIQLDHSVPQYVYTDLARLRQILTNLLDNAIKFTQHGQITIQGSAVPILDNDKTSTTDTPSHLLRLVVKDTGVGIAPQILPNIFEAFTQSETIHHPTGTGLGLNISQQLATLLGGSIVAHSQVGQGSTFTLTLPVQLSTEAENTTTSASSTIIGLAPGQAAARILIIENDVDNQKYLRSLLQQVGFETQAVHCAESVLQICEDWQPDLIFVDIQLLNHDAEAIVQSLKHHGIDGQARPLVVITTQTLTRQQTEILAVGLAIGCDGYMVKPVTAAQILSEIQRHLAVRYSYAPSSPIALEPSLSVIPDTPAMLSVEQLQNLPKVWLLDFHHALATGSTKQIYQLLDQLPVEFSEVAIVLENQVSKYQFQALLDLLEPFCHTAESAS
ncbi:PAS domain-containing protein [filamentous cyanobacterium LEGE 11480]|uniref:histidine kinase n=1 Tax=Romeriopsis navalis LEGE 11480 TaxID=2777977 RepID=A0A928Z3J0_9CYAN|nr:chemotaxis protein CheB [Romeriopsis navalis]MBE9030077.1 PAS domain-containing protein [Romeriopsis navalis LEGE 11480]